MRSKNAILALFSAATVLLSSPAAGLDNARPRMPGP